jgi:hypothetical protein
MTADLVPVETLPDVIETWRNAIEALDADRRGLAELGQVDMLAFGLDRIRELRRQLGDLERAVEADIAGLMDGKQQTIDGLGTLERRRGTDRKGWDSDEVLKSIVQLAVVNAIDPDTGELPSHTELVARVVADIAACAPLTASTGWRVTALRAMGIDPDEYCITKPGRTAVQIHKADAAA